jgi:hypothetical protein
LSLHWALNFNPDSLTSAGWHLTAISSNQHPNELSPLLKIESKAEDCERGQSIGVPRAEQRTVRPT